jgi:hypothetical protein
MERIKRVLCSLLLCGPGMAFAMDGVFDRSEEVAKYLDVFKTGSRGAVTEAAKEVFVSGIGDPTLATALKDRLLADYKGIQPTDKTGVQYLAWTTKALASFGIAEHAPALKQVCDGVRSTKVRGYCRDELARIEWHRIKNEIMASRKNYNQGDNPRMARYINLIQAEDFSHKYQGADRINWERLLEPRVMDAIAQQVELNLDKAGARADRPTTKTMGLFVKLLGYSGQTKYKETLQKVLDSKAGTLVKKHAKEALSRLQ